MSGAAYYIQLSELVNALGVEDAEKIVGRFGGTRVYVPGKLKPDHRLAVELGIETAEKLSAHIATSIGGLAIEVPVANGSNFSQYRDKLRRLASDRNMTEAKIAVTLGVHVRTVRRMRAKLKIEGQSKG